MEKETILFQYFMVQMAVNVDYFSYMAYLEVVYSYFELMQDKMEAKTLAEHGAAYQDYQEIDT